MNKSEFISLIQNPSNIQDAHIEKLEDLITNFPYCQSAYILLAKVANDSGSMLAQQKLAKAAAYTADRKNLKRIIQDKKEKPLSQPSYHIEPALNEALNEERVISQTDNFKSQNEEAQTEVKFETFTEKTITEKENVSVINDKEKFFLELQENLNKLRDLKNHAANIEKESKESSQVSADLFDDHSDAMQASTEEKIEDPGFQKAEDIIQEEPIHFELKVRNSTLLTSRLDEILVDRDLEGDSDTNSVDLMIEYLHYLGTKRNNFMRDKNKIGELIDKFIRENPGMPSMANIKKPLIQQDLASETLKNSKTLISENFARILLGQGKIDKAIDVYKELILKNPEKRAYFEALIEELKHK